MSALTRERLKELLDYDPATGIFVWKVDRGNNRVKVGSAAGGGGDDGRGYNRIMIDGKSYRSHRLAWLDVYGSFPPDMIDHINGIRDDNRIENLRAVSNQENSRNVNKSTNNTSGYLGVCWDKHKKSGTLKSGSPSMVKIK